MNDDHNRDPEIVFARAIHAHHDGEGGVHEDHERAHELFQSSMVSALLHGVFDGEMTFGELARHGDFGLGTFNALDGEMICVDGDFYALRSDGKAYEVGADWKTPFATVQHFEPEMEWGLDGPMTRPAFETFLGERAPKKNGFYAIRVDGRFSWMKVRSVPRQEKPYPSLVEVVKHQPVFEFENVSGSLVGFRLPDYTVGMNVPGYHLHFIDDARTCGGHVTRFTLEQGRLRVDYTSDLHLEIPETSGDFDAADLTSGDVGGDIRNAES